MSGIANWQAQIRIDIEDLKKRIKVAEGEINNFTNEDRKVKLDIDTKTLESAIQKLDKMLDSLGKGTGDFKQFENLSKELLSIVSEVKSLSKAFGKVDDSGAKILLSSIQNIDKSLSELNQNILNVNKNMSNMGGNTSGAVKQVENISNAYQDAAKEAEKLSDAQSKIGQKTNISSGSKIDEVVSSAKDLDKTLGQVDIPTDSFDKVLEKLDRTKSELIDIVKITKQSVSDADGKFHDSYTLKDSRGSTEIYGMNSKTDKGQILRQNIVSYDVKKDIVDNSKELLAIEKQLQKEIEASDKANQEKFQDFQKEQADYVESVNKVNSAIQKTDEILDTLPLHDKLDSQFLDMIDSVDNLNSKLKSGELALSEYKNEVKSITSEYSKMVSIQQKRDVEDYNANAKADNAKKLEREKQIWNELITSLDRYATLQKRIASNNTLSTDNEEATKLLEHIHELQRNDILPTEKLTASNEKLQQINQTVADLKAKLKESTLDSLQGSIDKYQKIYNQRSTYSSDFTPSEQYTKNLTELNTAIKNLVKYKDELKNVGEVTVEQEAHLKGLVAACGKSSDSFKSLSSSEKGASQIAVDKLVQRINKDLDECTNYSKEAKLGLRALRDELESANPRNLKEITSEIINIENAEIKAGRAGRSFFDTLKNSGFHQLAAQMAGMFGFYDVINLGKEAINTIKELDYALVDLKKTTAMNSSELEQFYYNSNDVAKQMGVTTEEIIDQASSWSRLGYNTREAATEMAKLSSQFSLISPGMDTTTAQEGLVSIMKAWDIGYQDVKSQIMDDINALGNNLALNNQDIVDGMERSAAALAAVGTSTKDAYALFSGIQEVLQNSEKSGTSLRSVALRLRSFDESTEEYSSALANITGELVDLTKTAEHAQGVSVFKPGSTTEFKSLVDYFREIADIWDEMSQKQQNDFLLKAFGRTQAQAGAALIQNFKGVEKALDVMDNAAGSADKEMETAKQSITYKLNALKETWVGTVQELVDRGDVGKIVDGLIKLSEGLGFVIDKLGIIGSIGLGAGIFSGIKNVGRDRMYSLSF